MRDDVACGKRRLVSIPHSIHRAFYIITSLDNVEIMRLFILK